MVRDIEFFELRNIKINGEYFPVEKFVSMGNYVDGNGNKYKVYYTYLNNKKVTFVKSDYSLLCTDKKLFFDKPELKKGNLDFYNWDIVTV